MEHGWLNPPEQEVAMETEQRGGGKALWWQAAEALAPKNRVHSGPDMHLAYEELRGFYPQSELIAFPPETEVSGWRAPPGWRVVRARLEAPDGSVLVSWPLPDVLSVFAYSPSFKGAVTKAELEQHLFSNPNHPDAVPYYFRNQYRFDHPVWGFCLPHRVREALPEGLYLVDIETEFMPAPLEMAMDVHEGELADSVLLVGHFDHPGQLADGLLGCIAGHEIIRRLAGRQSRLTYRMLSTVEIVGSVFYCHSRASLDRVKEAVFCGLAGIDSALVLAQSATPSASNRIFEHVLSHALEPYSIVGFREALGNDEIAFDVQGVGIPCSSLLRWPYAYYHTNLDNCSQIDPQRFERYIDILLSYVDVLERNSVLTAQFHGLPCLSREGVDLYLSPPQMSGLAEDPNPTTRELLGRLERESERAAAINSGHRFNYLMTLLPAIADGRTTTLQLANRAGVPFAVAHAYTDMWVERGLLIKEWRHPFEQVPQ